MLKRLVIPFAAICLLAVAPMQPFQARAQSQTPLQEALARLTPEQQARFKAYEAARISFQKRTDQYWRLIELKRKKRQAKLAAGKAVAVADYVPEQPPVYNGPPRPDDVMAMLPKPPPAPVEIREPVPIVTDFLRQAEEVYGFKPDQVNEDDFMILYAMEAVRLGLTRDQVVRLYALETGGMGTQNLQSGYNPRTGKAASTALGYAQLLAANTIEQVRKEGPEFAARLERQAADGSVPDSKAEVASREGRDPAQDDRRRENGSRQLARPRRLCQDAQRHRHARAEPRWRHRALDADRQAQGHQGVRGEERHDDPDRRAA